MKKLFISTLLIMMISCNQPYNTDNMRRCDYNIKINITTETNIIKDLAKYLEKNCSKHTVNKSHILAYYLYVAGTTFDFNVYMLADIMISESSCDSFAINKESRATGLMQIHPVHKLHLYSNDFENIMKGAEILYNCLNKYNNFYVALKCYGGVTDKIYNKYKNTYHYSYE